MESTDRQANHRGAFNNAPLKLSFGTLMLRLLASEWHRSTTVSSASAALPAAGGKKATAWEAEASCPATTSTIYQPWESSTGIGLSLHGSPTSRPVVVTARIGPLQILLEIHCKYREGSGTPLQLALILVYACAV